jgi:hypothetical protein
MPGETANNYKSWKPGKYILDFTIKAAMYRNGILSVTMAV